jgi:7 transmembrane receptor (rhodopsin family)
VVFAIMMYPTISDRILRTRDLQCRFEQSENFYPSIVISVLGGHVPSVVIVACYTVVYVEIRKLARTRPLDGVSTGPPTAMSGRAVAAAATLPEACNTDEAGTTMSPKAAGVRIGVLKINGLRCQKIRDRRLSAPSAMGVAGEMTAVGVPIRRKSFSQNTRRLSNAFRQQVVSIAQSAEASSNAIKREMKAFMTLSYIVVAYVVCWVPYQFVFDLSIFRPEVVPDSVFTTTFWMTYINSVLNPFLYALSLADVRKTVVQMLKCKT